MTSIADHAHPTEKAILIDFFKWLRSNTDTFDNVLIAIMIEHDEDIKPSDEMILELVDGYIESRS